MEDLARAIRFIHEHASQQQVDVKGYSFWGGSGWAAGYPEAAQLPEDAFAGRVWKLII